MPVELGFLEECEPWQVESRLFPSKVGGKPAWLSLKNIPSHEQLKCEKCQQTMIFLCQVYAPFENDVDGHNFHRTLFVFVCKNAKCCERNMSDNFKVFRSSLGRINEFYSPDPPEENPVHDFSLKKLTQLCRVCGCAAEKSCSQCKLANYCSKQHQVLDWKEFHKKECTEGRVEEHHSEILYKEWEMVMEEENIEDTDRCVNEEAEIQKFKQLEQEGKLGTMSNISEEDLDSHANSEKDKTFLKFKKKIDHNPEQVIRYDKGGDPLWIAAEPLPDNIPDCEYCGGPRHFEFQIMPQMLTLLKENSLDWGVIAIYTCKSSCTGNDLYAYKKEFVFKQDVAVYNVV